jgi:hypothetical protein
MIEDLNLAAATNCYSFRQFVQVSYKTKVH